MLDADIKYQLTYKYGHKPSKDDDATVLNPGVLLSFEKKIRAYYIITKVTANHETDTLLHRLAGHSY